MGPQRLVLTLREDETMKPIPYLITAIAIGMMAVGSGAAQTDELAGSAQAPGLMATPAKYTIGKAARFDEVIQRLAEQGFQVVAYELDDRAIEVEGYTATGHCMELKFHPASGKEMRRKRDDDCGPVGQPAGTGLHN